MAKKLFVSFVLDETGSMISVKDQTISGFNEYVDTLKKEADSKKVRFTLTKFNSDKVEMVLDSVKMSKVAHLNSETYQPAALTPLYDAIGQTTRSLENFLKSKKKSAKALVVIQTDGCENHSKEFNRADIFKLINEKKKDGWTFAFLGADQDAYAASRKIGIPQGNSMSYASGFTKEAFSNAAYSTSKYIRNKGKQTPDFFKKKEESESDPS